jgi:hypothetical protein
VWDRHPRRQRAFAVVPPHIYEIYYYGCTAARPDNLRKRNLDPNLDSDLPMPKWTWCAAAGPERCRYDFGTAFAVNDKVGLSSAKHASFHDREACTYRSYGRYYRQRRWIGLQFYVEVVYDARSQATCIIFEIWLRSGHCRGKRDAGDSRNGAEDEFVFDSAETPHWVRSEA